MTKPRIWALVADGVRARVLRGLEDGAPLPSPPTELISRSRSRRLRDILAGNTDPGHVLSQAERGIASEGPDLVRQDMRDFAHEISDRLDSHRRAGDFERLAIFATPGMLRLLRDEMSRALRGTVFLERRGNLVQYPEAALRDLVRTEIARLPRVAED